MRSLYHPSLQVVQRSFKVWSLLKWCQNLQSSGAVEAVPWSSPHPGTPSAEICLQRAVSAECGTELTAGLMSPWAAADGTSPQQDIISWSVAWLWNPAAFKINWVNLIIKMWSESELEGEVIILGGSAETLISTVSSFVPAVSGPKPIRITLRGLLNQQLLFS